MLKKYLSFTLIVCLFHLVSVGSAFAQQSAKKKWPSVEKVKKNIEKLGVGEKARSTVKLKDGTKLKGYIYQAGEDSFTIVDQKSGQKITVAYTDVAGVRGKNLSTGAKIAIGVGIGAAATFIILGLAVASALSGLAAW